MAVTDADRARRSAAVMRRSDEAFGWAGMELVEVTPGRAVTRMTVAEHHTNGHDICHGGLIFMLADSAFAYACNSRNKAAVAQHNTISFIAPGHPGDVLTATAREVNLAGRNGIYDVRVTRGDGSVIAEMRGCSRMIGGQHFDESGKETP